MENLRGLVLLSSYLCRTTVLKMSLGDALRTIYKHMIAQAHWDNSIVCKKFNAVCNYVIDNSFG